MLMTEGYLRKRQQQVQDMLYISWHVEAFARQKKLPKLEVILKTRAKQIKKRETDMDELIQTAKRKGLKGPWDR
jgi:hypothetical protein